MQERIQLSLFYSRLESVDAVTVARIKRMAQEIPSNCPCWWVAILNLGEPDVLWARRMVKFGFIAVEVQSKGNRN